VVADYRPDLILVQGDTATVFFAALVGFFERTRVGHVEAGLRSGEKWQPYPEEIFRRLSGVMADLHFAPTPESRWNLLAEGVGPEQIFITGNTVVDALHEVASRDLPVRDPALAQAIASGKRLVLLTAHSPTRTRTCSSSTPCTRTPTSASQPPSCWAATPGSA
jgi:UDP-N-acetylglucosamine 2-epimerase (non-hydrolysing)